jgi:hypothetical protein
MYKQAAPLTGGYLIFCNKLQIVSLAKVVLFKQGFFVICTNSCLYKVSNACSM